MKKRTIWMILALMSIALIGVIAVQVSWLARASHLEERLFKERVSQAMERVVRQIEAREMKAQVMKSLSDVRRTINDTKARRYKIKRAENDPSSSEPKQEENAAGKRLPEYAHVIAPAASSSAPASATFSSTLSAPHDPTRTKKARNVQGAGTSPKRSASRNIPPGGDSALAIKTPLSSNDAPSVPSSPDQQAALRVQADGSSFEMRFGNGSFSFHTTARTRTDAVRTTQTTAPASPNPIVVTVPADEHGQPLKIVVPQGWHSFIKKDSLAQRMKSRFYGNRTPARTQPAAPVLAGEGQTTTTIDSKQGANPAPPPPAPSQPYIGGRKTLEDRMNTAEMRRRQEEQNAAAQAYREAVQRELARSHRDLERLRRLNIVTNRDMRELDSMFQISIRQALQEFGSFGFEFRIPNIVLAPTNQPQLAANDTTAALLHQHTATSNKARGGGSKPHNARHGKKTSNAPPPFAATQHIHTENKTKEKLSLPSSTPASTEMAGTIIRDTIEKIIDHVDFVENIVETMFSGKRRVFSERVALNDLDSLLRNELRHNDIMAAFEYGVVRGTHLLPSNEETSQIPVAHSSSDSMMIIKTSAANNHLPEGLKAIVAANGTPVRNYAEYKQTATYWRQLLSSKYRARLFPNDLFPSEEYYLLVRFPHYSPGLSLAAIGSEVSLSAVFLLMIIGCFGFTLVALMKQKKLSDMKTDFINNMTHELKTPIATISIASEALKDDHVRSETTRVERFVNIIHDENKRLAGHVEKVLQAAQMDRGDLKLNLQETDIHTLIETAAESLALQVEQKNGRIELHCDAAQPEIQADEAHLMNVIFNLLDNANKYTPETPHIIIQTRNNAAGVIVTIQDNGIGMTREAQKHIFEKFYRVPTGNRHDVKGFGLGLNYVQTIIEAHGGSISVRSEYGKGSTFEVFMPFTVKHTMSIK